jgi:hypothetical protein
VCAARRWRVDDEGGGEATHESLIFERCARRPHRHPAFRELLVYLGAAAFLHSYIVHRCQGAN